jgi:hypothetical protein
VPDATPVNKKIVVVSLPTQVTVDGFAESYLQYVIDRRYQSIWLNLIGGLLAVVGFITLLTGPSTISYSLNTGPSFLQLIQMYPGPIVTVGLLLLGLNRYMETLALEGLKAPAEYLLDNYDIQVLGHPLDAAKVSITYLPEAEFAFAEIPADLTSSSPKAPLG